MFKLIYLDFFSIAFLPAAETKCNAKHNTSVCSVTPGGSVSIQLMTNASGHQLRCKKQLSPVALNVFSLKRDKVTVYEPFRNRTEFFINSGTLKINNVERNDSGLYTTEVFDPNGVLLRKINVTLDVQGKWFKIYLPAYFAL